MNNDVAYSVFLSRRPVQLFVYDGYLTILNEGTEAL